MSQTPVCPGTLTYPGNIPTCSEAWQSVDMGQQLAASIDALKPVLIDLFQFDLDLFGIIDISLIMAWVSGAVGGMIFRAWKYGQ